MDPQFEVVSQRKNQTYFGSDIQAGALSPWPFEQKLRAARWPFGKQKHDLVDMFGE
jgi:hypothetical protein